MPTYQYVCTDCTTPLEVQQAFTDDPVTQCPSCPGRLRKVFSAVGVVFKGSGFYRTDNRSKPAPDKAPAESSKPAASSTEPKPAAKTEKSGASSAV